MFSSGMLCRFSIPSASLLGVLFDPEDRSSTFFRKISKHISDYTASHPISYLRESLRSYSCYVDCYQKLDWLGKLDLNINSGLWT
jgi:hypothetical protein